MGHALTSSILKRGVQDARLRARAFLDVIGAISQACRNGSILD